ncbi:MAG: PAS domain-containing protein [Cyanobacteria bacterium SZAS LIN-2]|nr:PAS domain-containing protein [Cyanobacteria bacterium SZAS LIN-2]
MYLLDINGTVLHANQACLDLLAVNSSDFVGHDVCAFFAEASEAAGMIADLSAGTAVKSRPVKFITGSGGEITALLQANVCLDGGLFKYSRWFMQDISGQALVDRAAQLKSGVLKVLAESANNTEALAAVVPVIAQAIGCEVGLAWRANEKANQLERLVLWRANPHADATFLLSKCNNISLVLASGFPAANWFSDRAHVINSRSEQELRCCGSPMSERLPDYKQIISVPIAIGRLNWGLLGFFSREEICVSAECIALLEDIGREIGRFVERQNAFENYQKLQESYSLAIAGANDGIWDWDFNTNEAYFSPRWKSLLGYEDHELENHFETFRALTHPDDYPRVMDAVQRHMETKEPYDEQCRMRTKDGDYIWISTRGHCSYDAQGKPVRMSGSHRDITDLKEAELARQRSEKNLLESESKFRQLAENIREVFWIVSADQKEFIYVSPAFEEFWGASCQDLYSNASLFFETMVKEDRDKVLQLLNSDFVDPAGLEIEFRIAKTGSARPRWMWARIFPVTDHEGNIERFCGIAHDITNKKEVEKHVHEFYSTISHELRTPLTSIRAALGLVEGGLTGNISRETLEYTSIARDNCDRLIRLISDMLDIKKIEANHLELRLARLSPRDIVQATVESVKPYAEQSGVILEVLPSTAGDCLGDSDRVMQILTNLLSNAIRFTPPGKTVKISAEQSPSKGPGNIRFAVRDEGPGIGESEKLDIFGPFQQLSCIENQVNRGTGLGLAISKVLAEKQNGTIGVNSRLGEGAEFWFELPPYTADSIGVNSMSSSQEGSPQSQPTILLLEDSESIAMILAAVLNKNGYQVRRAATIAGARELFDKDCEPALVIADVNLPDGSGLTFVNWMQQQKGADRVIPAIILSGATPNLETIQNRDAVDWVRKPFDNNKLLALIKKRISSPSASGPHRH